MFSGTYTPEDSVNYTMMFLIDMDNDGLIVFPTHRMVRNLEQFSELDAVERMNAEFNIEKREDLDAVEAVLAAHDDRHAIAFYTGGAYYYLLTLNDMDAVKKMMPDMSDAYCDLDVTVLHSLIFDKVFGITKEDLAKQTKVTYTRSVHEALTGVQNGAVLLHPESHQGQPDQGCGESGRENAAEIHLLLSQADYGTRNESSGLEVTGIERVIYRR